MVLSVQNNNPGNLRPRGSGTGFQRFEDPQSGLQAMKADLRVKVTGASPAMKARYGEGYQPTLRNVLGVYAPPEENDTDGYVQFVSQKSGINPDQPLSEQDVDKFIPAMVEMEGGKEAVDHFFGATQPQPQKKITGIADIRAQYPQYDDMSDQQLADAMHKKYYSDLDPKAVYEKLGVQIAASQEQPAAAAEESKGFGERVGERYQERTANMQESADAYVSGEQGKFRTGFQTGGQMLHFGVNDVPAEALTSVGKVIPKPVKEFGKDVLSVMSDPDHSPVASRVIRGTGFVLNEAAEGYQKFKKNHPGLGRDLDATFGYGSALAALTPIKGKTIPGASASAVGKPIEAAGKAIFESGEAALKKKKTKFLQNLITPKETPKVKEDLFSRSTEQGVLRTRVPEATAHEKDIIESLSDLPLKENKSLLANYNIISEANTKETQSLISKLEKSTAKISDEAINSRLNAVKEGLSKNPYITGDGATAAERVLNGALEAIAKNDKTPAGLLQARKDFDGWVRSLKGEKAFDPNLDTPVTTAVQEIRQAINDMVDKAVPDAGVKQSLRKQSNMYRAMDRIETKGGLEGKNIVTRTAQKAANLIPVKGALAKTGLAAATVGGVALAPALTGIAALGYLTAKGVSSPTTRKAVGNVLKATGRAATKDIMPKAKNAKSSTNPLLSLQAPAETKLLAAPGKLSAVPMSEQEIAIAQAKMTRGKSNPVQTSGASTKTPVSQFNKLSEKLGKQKGKEFQDTVQIFKDGDMSQNEFVKDVTSKFGLSQTQARSLAKEIRTYKK